MMRGLSKRVLTLSAAVVMAVAGFSISVEAQPGRGGGPPGMGMNLRQMMGGTDFRISPQSIEMYGKLLGMSVDQIEAAKALRQGHVESLQPKLEELNRAREEAREVFRETRDPSVWQGLMEQTESVSEAREKAEKAFLDDMKTLLNPEQAAKWPRIERAQRRESLSMGGLPFGIPGDRVDLFRLVQRVDLDAEEMAKVDPVLERYEAELDPALARRTQLLDDGMNRMQEFFQAFQEGRTEELNRRMNEFRDAMVRIRDVNRRYIREIEAQLSPESAAKVSDEFRREAYPQVYAQQRWGLRALEAAMAFEDLNSSQKQSIEAIRESYLRDLSTINERAEKAVDESSMQAFDLNRMMQGGWMGGNNEAMQRLRNDRRELDDRADKSLRDVLTEDQVARLPARPALERGGGDRQRGVGGGMPGGGEQPRRPQQQPRGNRVN
jgi:hypothetical protein